MAMNTVGKLAIRALAVPFLLAGPPSQADQIFRDSFEPEASGKLNDTGLDWCADASAALSCPQSSYPGQDGDYGRDALARNGQLQKIGSGAAGFDFTKISNIGQPLPESAVLGDGPNDWACNRDNHTGLVWEVKTSLLSSLRASGHNYTWYDAEATTNGGVPGNQGDTLSCSGTLPRCNTAAFVARVNLLALCGYNDWRLPSPDELLGITNFQFYSASVIRWTSRTSAWYSTHAWYMVGNAVGIRSKVLDNAHGVRLVRGAQ